MTFTFYPLDVRDHGAEIPDALRRIWLNPAACNWWPSWWGWIAALSTALEAEHTERTTCRKCGRPFGTRGYCFACFVKVDVRPPVYDEGEPFVFGYHKTEARFDPYPRPAMDERTQEFAGRVDWGHDWASEMPPRLTEYDLWLADWGSFWEELAEHLIDTEAERLRTADQPPTPWVVLGLEPTRDTREIKRAYAKLVRLHPPEGDPDAFARVRAAYEEALQLAPMVGDLFPAGDADTETVAKAFAEYMGGRDDDTVRLYRLGVLTKEEVMERVRAGGLSVVDCHICGRPKPEGRICPSCHACDVCAYEDHSPDASLHPCPRCELIRATTVKIPFATSRCAACGEPFGTEGTTAAWQLFCQRCRDRLKDPVVDDVWRKCGRCGEHYPIGSMCMNHGETVR